MFTISAQQRDDGTVRIWACEWYHHGPAPRVIFQTDWRRERPFQSAEEALRFVASATDELLTEWLLQDVREQIEKDRPQP